MKKLSKVVPRLLVCVLLPSLSVASEVRMWEEDLEIPTWEIGLPEVNPIFEWSSGRSDVYPYPYKEILTSNKVNKTYRACWLENEFIKVLILPQIGGRLHGAKDKTNDYNFFYWQPTIKPGLVGMTGAWISGGIEWNFPHGHRPTGFSPVQYRLEENSDGSKTVWVGETEWVYRMRWIVGLTVYPGSSLIEAKVRLVNPTPLRHSFQMWTTTATNANENYQAVFPTRLMTGHGKKQYWHWPIDNGTDLSWWKNVPNAASYFAVEPGEFFGAWDHGKSAGTVITGNSHIVVGKKFWTWGTAPFGRIWEPKLTDGEGPYLEPQAGAYSDNQPDYHWIEPGEIKSYSHFFFPVKDIGLFSYANVHGALALEANEQQVQIGVYSTSSLKSATIQLKVRDKTVFEKTQDLSPSFPFSGVVEIPKADEMEKEMTLNLAGSDGQVLISYAPEELGEVELPKPEASHPAPEAIGSVDELWHHGDLIYKFRDPARSREYFDEGLRRDSGNSRAHVSLAELDIKQASYDTALQHLAKAEERDPDNGKIFYLRGLALEALAEYDEAYDAYYRSVHFEDHLARAYHRIALLDLRKGEPRKAALHVEKALESSLLNPKLWILKAIALRLTGSLEQAEEAIEQALRLDPIDPWAACEWSKLLVLLQKDAGAAEKLLASLFQWDSHPVLETALEYADAGLYGEASALLQDYNNTSSKGSILGYYYDAYFKDQMGQPTEAKLALSQAMRQSIDYVFPFRTEAIRVLENALEHNPNDGTAHYFLGLVYAKLGDLEKSISHWETAVKLVPENPRAWRNLGLAFLHGPRDADRALQCYEKAFALAPNDSRILLELDETRQQLGEDPAKRLSLLNQHISTVESRDDLLKSMLDLMVRCGEYEQALVYFNSHHFKLWEGRYEIHNAYIDANLALARTAKTPQESLEYLRKACLYPENLEVAPREPNLRGFLYYPMAKLNRELGNDGEAQRLLKITSEETTDPPTLGSYYQALALRDLGETERAELILTELRTVALRLLEGKSPGYVRRGGELQQALGHFYLGKLEEVSGNTIDSKAHLDQARSIQPMIEREAIMIAQRTYARAHQ